MSAVIVGLVVAGCLSSAAWADPLFCAVGWGGEFTHIDAAAGQVPPTHTDLPAYMQALAWSPDGTLYAGRGRAQSNLNELYALDPWTGTAEYLFDLPLPEYTGMRSLAIAADNQAYIVTASTVMTDPWYICTVDLDTAELLDTVILTGEFPYAQGMAFGPNGTLYGIASMGTGGVYTLVSIDLDGQTHIVGRHDQIVHVDQSIVFTPDGRLFGLGNTGVNFSELDPTDGSLIGPAHTISGDLRALALIPEPIMLPVLAAVALGLRRRRR